MSAGTAALTSEGFLIPDWDAPPGVRAAVSTRRSPGMSQAPYDHCNLGDHVGDEAVAVRGNRDRLRQVLGLPDEPIWLRQVHGTRVFRAEAGAAFCGDADALQADAAYTADRAVVLAIMTADCLPILLCADDGSEVAAAHAGWRGLAAGVIEATVQQLHAPPQRLQAWLGPAIGRDAFEVGAEVRAAFIDGQADAAVAFRPHPSGHAGKWLCDLHLLARLRLRALGVERIGEASHCTYSEPDLFYSYRRDGRCGRMASLIWLER
jgi:polyphenol oxidase